MEYKIYSIENNKLINEITKEIVEQIIEQSIKNVEINNIEIIENHFLYEEKELHEDYVSTGYFNFNTFLNIGNYLNLKGN